MEAKIAKVMPITGGIFKSELSYYTTGDICVGDLVEVQIRKKFYPALVSSVDEAKMSKSEIKNADFNLKKVNRIIGPSIYSLPCIEAARHTGRFSVATTGQTLKNFTSKKLLDQLEKTGTEPTQDFGNPKSKPEKFIFQHNYNERVGFYKTFVREAFAKNKSIVMVVPQHHFAMRLQESLNKGVGEYCVTLSNGVSDKKLQANIEKVKSEKHSLLIITTPAFLTLTRPDIGSYVLEFEHERGYVNYKRPNIDARHFVEILAHLTRSRLIIADTILRSETLHRYYSEELSSIGTPNFRSYEAAKQTVIDMREDKNPPHPSLSVEAFTKINDVTKSGGKVIIFAVRDGLAQTTYCGDCGQMLTYEGSPMVLYTDQDTQRRYFKSPKFKKIIDAQTVCPNCNSWNLKTYGVGSEGVEEALDQFLPKLDVLRIDAQSTSTETQVKKKIAAFKELNSGILITTQKGLKHITEPVELVVIASLDTLFNIPQFDMYEQIIQKILKLTQSAKNEIIIQTRMEDKSLLKSLSNKKLTEFYERDIEERKAWSYPPFSRLLKMTYTNSESNVRQAAGYLKKVFEDYSPYIFIARSPLKEGHKTVHMILKLNKKDWPLMTRMEGEVRKSLYERFDELSPDWTITIDPHNV